MKYLFFLIILFTGCRNKTNDALLTTKLKDAILQKDIDSTAFARFKIENAAQFKVFDSLNKAHQITAEQKLIHDSLMQTGVKLGMKFVKDQLKIIEIKKQKE